MCIQLKPPELTSSLGTLSSTFIQSTALPPTLIPHCLCIHTVNDTQNQQTLTLNTLPIFWSFNPILLELLISLEYIKRLAYLSSVPGSVIAITTYPLRTSTINLPSDKYRTIMPRLTILERQMQEIWEVKRVKTYTRSGIHASTDSSSERNLDITKGSEGKHLDFVSVEATIGWA